MTVKWLLESDKLNQTQKIIDVLDSKKIEYKIASDCEFDEDWLNLFPQNSKVIFYGSINMGLSVKGWYFPGIYFTYHNYDCKAYYPYLKPLLAEKYIMLPYGDMKSQKEFLYSSLAQDNTIFIRPDTCDKKFTGKVIYKEEFEDKIDHLGFGNLKSSDLIVVSEPRNVDSEWRFIIINDKVVTGSQYVENGKSCVSTKINPKALELAEKATKLYRPDPIWCVDICKTKSDNYYFLEIGSFNCAGLYACDLNLLVDEINNYVGNEVCDDNS